MTKPEFPLICIDPELFVDLVNTESFLSLSTAYSLISTNQREGPVVYDRAMNEWSYEQTSDRVKNNFFTRILAKTVYNPNIAVNVIWTYLGTYDLEELKKDLTDAVEADDDILTQYVDGDIIKNELSKQKTFDDVISLLKKYIFEVTEREPIG